MRAVGIKALKNKLSEYVRVVRRGWLRPPIAPPEVLPARKPVAPLADLLRELEEDRGDR